jgi:hypothetical protein
MTMPRPSLVTSSGPSPVRGFIAAILIPFLPGAARTEAPAATGSRHGRGSPVPAVGPANHNRVYQSRLLSRVQALNGNDQLRFAAKTSS